MLSLLDLYDNLTSRMPGFAQFICCTPSTVNGNVLPTAGFTFPSDTNSIIFSSCSILVLEFKDIAVTPSLLPLLYPAFLQWTPAWCRVSVHHSFFPVSLRRVYPAQHQTPIYVPKSLPLYNL